MVAIAAEMAKKTCTSPRPAIRSPTSFPKPTMWILNLGVCIERMSLSSERPSSP